MNANAVAVAGQPLDNQLRLIATSHLQPGTRTGYIGVADFFRILKRRRWLILPLIGVALIFSMIFLARTSPIYTATTTVMVMPSDPSTSMAAPTLAPNVNEEALIQTKVELLQSRPLARETWKVLDLGNDPEFAPRRGEKTILHRLLHFFWGSKQVKLDPKDQAEADERARVEATTDNLINHVNVSRVARSNVISISASSVDPVKASRIANRLVDVYIHSQISDAKEDRQQEIKALTGRVEEVRGYLQQADSDAASYRREHGLLSARPEGDASGKTSELAPLLAQAQAESAAQSRLASPNRLPDGRISASSAILTDLNQQEAVLARKLNQLTSFYGPAYPEIAQTNAELATVRTRIARETERLQSDLKAQAGASQARTAMIGAAIAGIRSDSFGAGAAAVTLRALERKVDAVNTLYTTLLNQLNTKIGALPDVDPDISRISRAPVPVTPSYPLPKQVLITTLVAALVIGIVFAFVIETMDTKLRTAEQIQRLLGIPTLAMVPELEEGNGPVHGAVADRPRSRFAEAMRNLLIEIESRIDREGARVVVVTSPLDGEGKNTIAASLAAAASVIGRNVVIVDFDLRRPSINGGELSPAGAIGVTTFLAKHAGVEDLVVAGGKHSFSIIGVGEAAADPGALIASPRLPMLIDELRQRFELVILNAPPILPVRDAKTLSGYADAALLVLRWGRTSPEAAAAAMESFGRPIIGAVLNRVDYSLHADRGYGDAIHHMSRSSAYYDIAPEFGRSTWTRVKRWTRSAAGRTAERLHLN